MQVLVATRKTAQLALNSLQGDSDPETPERIEAVHHVIEIGSIFLPLSNIGGRAAHICRTDTR